jgi:riboflavin synthase
MFTGIVTAVGTVRAVDRGADRLRLAIEAPYDDVAPGESVAINGACLTVVSADDRRFVVEVVKTSRDRTTLGDLTPGVDVNLERALKVGDRLGGHLVQGHVDGVAEVTRVADADDARLVDLTVPEDVARTCVPHGSITVDGVSLTINALTPPRTVQVALIPYTRQHTTLGALQVGGHVQVEGDVIGKYVRRLYEARCP